MISAIFKVNESSIVELAKKSILAVGLIFTGGIGNLKHMKSSGLEVFGSKPNK